MVQRERLERSSRWPSTSRSTKLELPLHTKKQSRFRGCQGRVHPTGPQTKLQSRFTCPCIARQKRMAIQQARNTTRCCHTSRQPLKHDLWCRWHGFEPAACCLPSPHISPAIYCDRASPRVYGVALEKRAQRTVKYASAHFPSRALYTRASTRPRYDTR